MELAILGAGPAYSDYPGAIGAAYLLSWGTTRLVLDLGQGTFTPLAGAVDPTTVDAIVVSHLHPDHFVDLVPLRHYLRWECQPPRRLRIVGPRDLAGRLDALHADPGFSDAALDMEPLDEGSFTVGGFGVVARKVRHTADSYAFRVSWGDGPGLVYTGDCGRAEDIDPLVRPGDTLLSEVSFGPSPGDPHAAHLSGPDVGALATRTGVERVLLTHLGMGHDRVETVDSVCRLFTGPAELVEPGSRYSLR